MALLPGQTATFGVDVLPEVGHVELSRPRALAGIPDAASSVETLSAHIHVLRIGHQVPASSLSHGPDMYRKH